MNEKKLAKRDESFCRYYTSLRNPREAAIRAGFTVMPEYRAMCLLSKKNVRERIRELENETADSENLLSAGFRRLAFGSSADAVRLILSCGDGKIPDIDSLDLFSVSEIKYSCGKGMEIKFFDRLKALEKLAELVGSEKSETSSFYEALERSASLNKADDDDG